MKSAPCAPASRDLPHHGYSITLTPPLRWMCSQHTDSRLFAFELIQDTRRDPRIRPPNSYQTRPPNSYHDPQILIDLAHGSPGFGEGRHRHSLRWGSIQPAVLEDGHGFGKNRRHGHVNRLAGHQQSHLSAGCPLLQVRFRGRSGFDREKPPPGPAPGRKSEFLRRV